MVKRLANSNLAGLSFQQGRVQLVGYTQQEDSLQSTSSVLSDISERMESPTPWLNTSLRLWATKPSLTPQWTICTTTCAKAANSKSKASQNTHKATLKICNLQANWSRVECLLMAKSCMKSTLETLSMWAVIPFIHSNQSALLSDKWREPYLYSI